VVNVPASPETYFGKGTEEDWLAVLGVHLGGYLKSWTRRCRSWRRGRRILGVTSARVGPADRAYSCAKRAVAA